MAAIYLKLTGPNSYGKSPKAAVKRNWQDPDYAGAQLTDDGWYGLRLDAALVIDADSIEAKDAWLAHIDQPLEHTWVRQTPRSEHPEDVAGFHFIYRPRSGVKSGKLTAVHPKLELKTGCGHYITFIAPGYSDLYVPEALSSFDPSWIPTAAAVMEIERYDQIPHGSGHDVMRLLAWSMSTKGFSLELIEDCLEAVNQIAMSEQPMSRSRLRTLAKSTVVRIAPETI